uniref:Amino acid transporter transmembrane domain-containing protein n=1 Tax=Ditylenchus dipsaci TaxID=166011 RepID=A0A915CQX6_9BILA
MAMFTTSLAVALIVVGASLDYGSFGTFIFAYGGHAVFPTIQHDMRKPHEFTKSSILAFSIMVSMYTPVSIMGYMTYGDSLRESVINSLQTKWIQQSVNMLITIHCILTLTIVFNPINQEVEEFFHVPHEFGVKRVLVRSSTLLAIVFKVTHFWPLLDFVGGSTLTLTSLIFPCLFYLYLTVGEQKAKENVREAPKNGLAVKKNEPVSFVDVLERSNKVTLFCCTFIALFGIIGGAAATFSAIREMSYAHFIPPCYVSAFLNITDPNNGGHTNCCGAYQNISMYGNASLYCSEPDFKFYTD